MANNIEVKCNFTTVFANYDNIEDLKAIANNICAQVKTAFEARAAEIKKTQSAPAVEVQVEVHTPTKKPSVKSKVETTAKPEAKAPEPKQKTPTKGKDSSPVADEVLLSLSDTAAIKKLGLKFEKYNDKCWVLRGDTKPLRNILREEFKGVFNSRLEGGEGWIIRTKNAQECAKALGLKVKVA